MTEKIKKTYSQMRKDFYKKYTEYIVPTVRKYEKDRKKKLILTIFVSTILFIAACFLLYLAYTNGGFAKKNEGILKLSLLSFIFSYFSWSMIKKVLKIK